MAEVFKVEGKVVLDTSEFHSAVDEATEQGKELAEELGESAEKAGKSWENVFAHTLGDIIADFTQQVTQALIDFAKESVSIASDLQEVQNVVDVTFGEGAQQIEQWAKTARTQFGLTELQAKQFASTMGAMLKSMDVPTDQIYEMSTALAGLAADMASFYNISFDDAFTKLRAGISGETEPLKQLGINLSVATLEAYALKNGITEQWQAMTQAEQAVLRYNYIMEAAADAQGDFARTSDSYANSMRVLETNINSLKGEIGEAFIPTLTDAVNWLNKLFEVDAEKQLAQLEQGFSETASAIELNSAKARGLLDVIEELQGKQSLTADETLRYKGAVQVLCEIYPELSKYVDQTSGFFTESAAAIRQETTAIGENLLEKAKLAYQQERLALLAADAAKAEYEYARTTAELAAASKALEEYQRQAEAYEYVIRSLYKNAAIYANEVFSEVELDKVFNSVKSGAKTIEEALRAAFLGTDLSGFFADNQLQIDAINGYKNVDDAVVQLTQDTERLTAAEKEQAEAAKTTAEAYQAELDFLGQTSEGMADAADSAENMADGLEKAEDKTEDFKEALKDLKKEAESVKKMFEELEQYKLENFEGIKKQVEGVYGVFDKAGKVKGVKASKLFEGMDSQIQQLERFQTAYQQLQEMGAGDDLLSQFEFSPESIGQMEALIKSGTEGVATANEKMTELATKQTEVATMLSETALAVDTEFKTMLTAAETANQELTEKMTTIQTAASEMATDVTTNSTTASEELDKVQKAGDTLGLSEWKPKINPEDNATSVITSVSSALSALDGTHVYTYIHTVYVTESITKPGAGGTQSGGTGAGVNQPSSRAVGLDYVPYDEYSALLHKGEAVLTKAEADNWRKGSNKVSSGLQPINVTLNLQSVAQNPYDVADEVKNALELMRWRA